MYKILALFGEAGSGKDTILNKLIQKYPKIFNPIISCTTRPPREGEVNGVNYHFLTIEEFAKKIENDEMLEATCFNKWMYGTEYSALHKDKINIGVFNPQGIENIILDSKVEVYAYYIDVKDKERLLRQLNRENNPNISEIIRRFNADTEDFAEIGFDYNVLPNNTKKDFKRAINLLTYDAKFLSKN